MKPPVDETLTPKRENMHPDIVGLLTALKKKMDERYRKKGLHDFGFDTAVLDALANLLIKDGWKKGGPEKGHVDHSDPRLFMKESTVTSKDRSIILKELTYLVNSWKSDLDSSSRMYHDESDKAYDSGRDAGVSSCADDLEFVIKKLSPSTTKKLKKESTCRTCGGDGWYVEADHDGEAIQVQCHACYGQGGTKDPEPNLRPSGEPKHEPFNEMKSVCYNGGVSDEESCKMCGNDPCKCMSLAEIIKKIT